jgi:hypothetical protein
MKRKHYIFLIGILLTHLLLLIFLKLTAWPEMSLWPYLMTKGWLPYRDIAIAHTPLMLFNLAIFLKIFGTGILQLKIFTWLLILSLDGIIFVIVRKLWNIKTAFLSVMAYGLWMLFYDGNGLWFDLYMGFMAFLSFYFAKKKNWFWTGIFWALAFISKQTAVWFLIPIGLEMASGKWLMIKRSAGKFFLGVLPVATIFTIGMLVMGILPNFWNWSVKFGVFTLPGAVGQIQSPGLRNFVVAAFPLLVFVPLFLKFKTRNLDLLFWAAAGTLGSYPRFEFFHFQPAVPFLAIATGLFLIDSKIYKKFTKVFAVLYIIGVVYLSTGYFIRNVGEGTRFYEADVESVVLYIKYNTDPGDRIFVVNWWDNLYALTDTLPSTIPWVPQLSWYLERPGIQEKMVEGLKENPPELIIFNPYTDFGLSAYVPEKVYNYITENYKIFQKVDGVEILVQRQP